MKFYVQDAQGNTVEIDDAEYRKRGGGGGTSACCTPKTETVQIRVEGTLPPPTYGMDITYYLIDLPADGTISPPLLAGVQTKQQLFVLNINATSNADIDASPGEPVNGETATWTTLTPHLGVLLRKMDATNYAGVQGVAAP